MARMLGLVGNAAFMVLMAALWLIAVAYVILLSLAAATLVAHVGAPAFVADIAAFVFFVWTVVMRGSLIVAAAAALGAVLGWGWSWWVAALVMFPGLIFALGGIAFLSVSSVAGGLRDFCVRFTRKWAARREERAIAGLKARFRNAWREMNSLMVFKDDVPQHEIIWSFTMIAREITVSKHPELLEDGGVLMVRTLVDALTEERASPYDREALVNYLVARLPEIAPRPTRT